MFELLFIVLFLIGLLSFINVKYIIVGIAIVLSFPFSNYYSSWHYKFGVMAVDGFFIGLIPYFLFLINRKKVEYPNRLIGYLIIIFLLFLVYFFEALQKNIDPKKLSKEIRPLLILFEMFILLVISKNISRLITLKLINNLAFVASVSNLIWFLIGYFNFIQYTDAQAQLNTNRYIDLSTYFSAYYIIHKQFLKTNLKFKFPKLDVVLILSILSLLISGTRILFLSTVIAIGIVNNTSFKKKIKYLFWSGVLIFSFIQFSLLVGQERVLESFSKEGFILQISNRFSPAMLPLSKAGLIDLIFGHGLGYYFDIPWFEYRELDNLNVSVDSAYLTHFVKQGIFGLIFLLIAFKFLTYTYSKKLTYAFIAFWFIQFFVEASLYQNVIFGIGFYLFLLNNFNSSNETIYK
jgi:hypothetical protein